MDHPIKKKTPATLRNQGAGFVMRPAGGWLREGWLLAVGWGVFVESDHGEHFAGFFAGFGVHEEVLHEDLWSGGVRGAVLVVVVFFLTSSLFCAII